MTDATLIKSIAFELSILEGEVWTAEITGYYSDNLNSETGNKLYIEESRGRIYTGAGAPADCTQRVTAPDRITASATRTAAAIARDIQSRFLPQARDYWQRCREEQARHDQRVIEINQAVERLATVGLTRATWRGNDENASFYGDNIKAQTYDGKELYNFELSHITIEQAIQIIKLIRKEESSQ